MRMRQGLVIKPPEILEAGRPVVFLAGPIQGGPPWHGQAIEIIHDLNSDLVIASPAKDYASGEFVYEKQVDWETRYLKLAAKFGGIMFWLARQVEEIKEEGKQFPRAYAQTTRQELGEWRNEKKHRPQINLVVGIEKGFGNARYIRRRLEQDAPDVPILSSLEETCQEIVRLVEPNK